MDCSLPGSRVHGIFQARVLEWVTTALSFTSNGQNVSYIIQYVVQAFFFTLLSYTVRLILIPSSYLATTFIFK